jgi:hypothetical protein
MLDMNEIEFGQLDYQAERHHTERFDPDLPETEVPQEDIDEVERDLKTQRKVDIERQNARIDATILDLKLLLGYDDPEVQRVERRLSVLKQHGDED